MVQTSWLEDPLGLMIGPLDAGTFFKEFHQRAPLLCRGHVSDRFEPLLSLQDVDTFLDAADLRADMVSLARAGRMVDPRTYVSANGRVVSSALVEEYLKGATIILQHLHESIGRLSEFCRGLETIFTAHAQTNIYLTPPGEQGFAPHSDAHDVFVLQLSGRKRWHVHPAAGEASSGLVHVLEPGDALYLPKGRVHDAAALDEAPSLHITVGLVSRSWADLLVAAVRELELVDPSLGSGLPPRYASKEFASGSLRERFEAFSTRLAEPEIIDQALASLSDDYLRERRPRTAGFLVHEPAPGQSYRARPLVQWRLRERGGELVLIGPGGDLMFEPRDRPALEIALSGEAFEPGSLPCPDPRRLFSRLWANGYLQPSSP